jgi:hypothetical protein
MSKTAKGDSMRKYLMSSFIVAAATLLSSACSTHAVTLSYSAANAAKPAVTPPVRVAVGDFTDNRHEPDRWIGAIRGGYGNPLKKLETDKPVSQLVKEAVRQALISRGLYDESGRLVLSGWIDKLDGDQFARKEATAQLQMWLTDRATQRELLRRPTSSNQIEGSVMTMKAGIFGSVEVLRSLIERVLSTAIDSYVDSSAFRDALQAANGPETRTAGNLKEAVHVGMPLIELTSVAPKPLSASDKTDVNGVLIGKTFTYDNGDGRLLIVTVENGVVTTISLK